LPKAEWLLADRGYDADWYRDALKDKGIEPCIPGRKSRGRPAKHDERRTIEDTAVPVSVIRTEHQREIGGLRAVAVDGSEYGSKQATEAATPSQPACLFTRAFNTDKAGQINRSEIFMLLRLDIEDPRWKEAMRAVRDAMRVVGSKTYVRCQIRDGADEAYRTVTIDLSKA
jgi:hypothetical protein